MEINGIDYKFRMNIKWKEYKELSNFDEDSLDNETVELLLQKIRQ